MGEQHVKKLGKGTEKLDYLEQLIDDIDALEQMLETRVFDKLPLHIGAEQELCLVDRNWAPSPNAAEILKEVNDPHLTHELARYNIEINLDPIIVGGDSFSRMHQQLEEILSRVRSVAEKKDTKLILTGILPTIAPRHLEPAFMTPTPRYKALNDAVCEIRKDDIELHIKGVDELNLHHDSVLYEGCNTSFQAHLQIRPEEFRDTYNWAQAIAGPVLSVCTNSPLLMGRELWEETRIALFTQSVDTRASTFYLDERESRVGFGNDWVRGNAADFYKESIVRFRSLLNADFETRSTEVLEAGGTPELKALGLHNGTVYKWNRLCYGQNNGNPHLRIENRYLPSGPSTTDEIANMMLWVGIMQGRPAAFDDIHTKMEFRDAKANFFNAARYGMASQFYWDGKLLSSQKLMLDYLLPMAFKGLYKMKVAPADAERYLSVIENRVRTQSGSRWMVEGYRKLRHDHTPPDAMRILTAAIHHRQEKGYTIDAWRLPAADEWQMQMAGKNVGDHMQTKIISAQEDDSAELVYRIMQWQSINHVPVLDVREELIGIVSSTDMQGYTGQRGLLRKSLQEFMTSEPLTVTEETPITKARELMESNKIRCLPVVSGKKLMGIITSNDI